MPLFNDRRGNHGTGKGRVIDLTDGGIGETQRRFNEGHMKNTALLASLGNDEVSNTPLSVEEAQGLSAAGTSVPIGGDELSRAKVTAKQMSNFKTYSKFRAANGKLKGTKGAK